jgi:hypothetical protein
MARSALERERVASLWENPDTFGTSLMALALDEWGTDIMDWEPQTLRTEIKAVYNADIPRTNMDKLMALITILSTDLFYISVEAFSHVANALNGAPANFSVMDPVSPEEAAWAITEAVLNDPPERGEKLEDKFSPEVRKFLGVILEDAGILTPPDVLGLAIMRSAALKQAETSLADDPVMFGGFFSLSQDKSKDIVDYVRTRTQQLVKQLDALPLQYKNSDGLSKYRSKVEAMTPTGRP